MLLDLYTRARNLWYTTVKARFEDERGAVGTEYALLLVLIAIVFVAGATALGNAINTRLNEGAGAVNTAPGT